MRKNKNVIIMFICVVIVTTISSISISNDVIGITNREVKFEVKPGILSLQPSFNRIQFIFHETEQMAFADAGTLLITDATGSGLGWQVSVKASPLTKVGKEAEKIKVLPPGSLTLSLENARIKVGEGSGVPPAWVGGINHMIDKDIPTLLLSADHEQGMGIFNVIFDKNSLSLKLPKDTVSKASYQSVLTWSIQQGP